MISKRLIPWFTALVLSAGAVFAHAQAGKAPDALIKEVSSDVLEIGRAHV